MDDEVKGEGNSVNYKYRMHDPRVGRFFAVDPLAPEYPHNGPYNFSENLVIAWKEREGLESTPAIYDAGSAFGLGETEFFLKHPIHGSSIGMNNGTNNISSTVVRFSTRGKNQSATKSVLNSGIEGFDEGGQIGAFRHVMWQAVITNKINADIAKKAGNAHETHFPDLTKRNFGDLSEADLTIDLLNNEIGRKIANENPDATTKELGILTLEHFKEKGLWTAEKVGENIKISQTKISDDQFNQLKKRFEELNDFGRTKSEQKVLDDKKDIYEKEDFKRKTGQTPYIGPNKI